MFEESLVESAALLRTHNRLPAIVSIALQALLVAIFLVIPLVYPEAIPFNLSRSTALAPPIVRPTTPPPPPQIVRIAPPNAAPSMAPATEAPRLQRQAILTSANPVDTPILALGIPGIPGSNPLSTLYGTSPAAARVVVAADAGSPNNRPIRLSSGVTAGLLMEPIQPVYPPLARMTHTEGTVVVQAIISRAGQIESAHILSGPPMLQASALTAVRSARYHPYLLNGQPTEVETTITIHFTMGS